MCALPRVSQAPTLSTITPMGMGPKALGSGACGLCRTFLGAHVPCPDRFHSKWMEVHMTNSSATAVTIAKMRSSLATLGLPEQLVTDNGPSFTSEEFAEFLQMNGIKHTTTAPYHPGSNGLAERAVQTLKRGLKMISEGSWEHCLARYLLTYRTTSHSTTGVSPSELMFGRQLGTSGDVYALVRNSKRKSMMPMCN